MTTTYILKSTVSDLGGGADFNQLLAQGLGIVNGIPVSLAAGATEDSYGFTGPTDPGATGATGDYQVDVNIDTGNTNIQLSVSLQRINSAGVVQSTSAFSLEQTATAGTKTFNFVAINLGVWAANDRLRVTYRFRNTNAMKLQVCNVTVNVSTLVVAPWTIGPVSGGELLLDICGSDIVRVDKWSPAGVFSCSIAINAVDENSLAVDHYGLVRFERSHVTANKMYYMYTPRGPGIGPTTPRFGSMDIAACTSVQLQAYATYILQSNRWNEFFGIDRNDNIIYLSGIGTMTPFGPACPDPTGTCRRLVKMDSTGAIIADPLVLVPPNTFTLRQSWLSIDGTKIYGLATDSPSPPQNWFIWSIHTTSGAFTTLHSISTPLNGDTIPNGTNLDGIREEQILHYLDGSVVICNAMSQDGYINCTHFSNTGVELSTFDIGGGDLGPDIIAMPGVPSDANVCAVAMDIDVAGTTIYLRLDYNCGSPGVGNCGRSKVYSTPYPLSAASVFTFLFDAYSVSYATCFWGGLQVNGIAPNPPIPPAERRIPQVTLIGAT